MSIAYQEFEYLRKFIYDSSSIVIEPGKEYLVEARLASIAYAEGKNSVQELLTILQNESPSSHLHSKVLDGMTNNETFFFRDVVPFELLRHTLIPAAIERNTAQRELSIWSAASSSGQEAYSIAILIEEHFRCLVNWQVHILGTDLSNTMLARARLGIYNQMEIQRGLSPEQLARHFSPIGKEWQINETIRSKVDFRPLNLFDSWSGLPTFDIIFLRNVLIYFTVQRKRAILSKVRDALRPGGAVILGGAETMFGLDDQLDRFTCGPISYYRRSI